MLSRNLLLAAIAVVALATMGVAAGALGRVHAAATAEREVEPPARPAQVVEVRPVPTIESSGPRGPETRALTPEVLFAIESSGHDFVDMRDRARRVVSAKQVARRLRAQRKWFGPRHRASALGRYRVRLPSGELQDLGHWLDRELGPRETPPKPAGKGERPDGS